MNSIFGRFMESWILRVSCKVNVKPVHGIMNTSGLLQSKWSPKGFTLTLQDTRSIHDSMNLPKIEFIAYIYIYIISQVSIFNFHLTLLVFEILWIKPDIT